MKNRIIKVFEGRIVSPWWIFFIDIFLIFSAFVFSYVLRLNFDLPNYSMGEFIVSGTTVVVVYALSFFLFQAHRGVIRHTSIDEFKKVLKAATTAFGFLMVSETIALPLHLNLTGTPRLVLIIQYLVVLFFCLGFRMVVRETYTSLTRKRGTINSVIFGAGEMGIITLEAISNSKENTYNVLAFVDDNPEKWNKTLFTLPVVCWEKILNSSGNDRFSNLEVVILAVNNLSIKRKQKISQICSERGWKLKVMPTVLNWVNGISNTNQIRDVKIEDLLGREEIQLSKNRLQKELAGKEILITGAAGSIGSEIVRQLMRFPVKHLLLLDQAESPLYDLQQELLLSYSDAPFELVICDVTNQKRLEKIFQAHSFDIVFDAAAYKHVPLMEDMPYEAVTVNIGGTKNLADLSVKFHVDKFVMVSTDKAVNPTNVMGATKRISEMYIQSLSQLPEMKTRFITTRFGNVLGSNGSVVPLFKKQIAQGGPLTVTHKDITRYFMTIPEASQLVLEAALMGHGGEIFVFDMGEPVKIDDLAKNMIRLAGLKLNEDIQIIYTGLRPGEKLYEELLASKENTLPTYHDKILIGKVRYFQYEEVNGHVVHLLQMADKEKEGALVSCIKEVVPEYNSTNAIYAEKTVEL